MAIVDGLHVFADPDLSTIRVLAAEPSERGAAFESVLGPFADRRPFWMDTSWQTQIHVSTLKTERPLD